MTRKKDDDTNGADELQLQALGHQGEMKRNFSALSMLGLAFAILNSWTALSASLSLALPSGGSVSVVWGLVTAGICNLCLAASLAEFLSAYPTAGGQYYWVAAVAWENWAPVLAWTTGWINVSGWVALVASGGLLGSQLCLGLMSFYDPDFETAPWIQFLIYFGYTLVAFLLNSIWNARLPHVNKAAIIWSILGFVVISVAILSCARPNFTTARFIFTDFVNETGWPNGIAWLLGLLQGGLGLTGYDAVAHMIEEIPNPSVEGPKIMIYCVCIGTFTGLCFLVSLLAASGGDTASIISSKAGPLLQILYNATKNRAASTCLLVFPLVCLVFATTAIMATASRMVYAFARDGGLPYSAQFARVNGYTGQPFNALVLTSVLVVIFGVLLLGSSSAVNAIISASVVALGVSYAIPISINCLRGRKQLPKRSFTLPEPLGSIANVIGIAYVLVTTVLFLFPPIRPVTASNMSTYYHRSVLEIDVNECQTTASLPSRSSSSLVPHTGLYMDASISRVLYPWRRFSV
jgi:amino acid permease (GABA permease)